MNNDIKENIKPWCDQIQKEFDSLNTKYDKILETLNTKDVKNTIDPAFIGIPNINFSLMCDFTSADKEDISSDKYTNQRISRGFDDSETFNLGVTIMSFILPRLELYIQLANERIVISDGNNEKYKKLVVCMRTILDYENNNIDIDNDKYEEYHQYVYNNLGVVSDLSW